MDSFSVADAGDASQCSAPLPSVHSVSLARSSALDGGSPSLLEVVDLAWMLLVGGVIFSPLLRWSRDKGAYGKLRHGKKDDESEVDSSGSSQAQHHADGSVTDPSRPSHAAGGTASDEWKSPSLHVSTRTAFVSYYLFASVLNGMMLAEVMYVFFNLNYDNTPLLNLVRSLAAWFTPSASELSSPRVHARTAAEGQRMLARLMLQMWLFQLHLGRRLYESVAVTRFSQRSTQHGIITVMAFVYYFLCVVTPVVDSPVCATWDSGLFPNSNLALWFGVLLFGAAWWGQHEAHVTLAELRGGAGAGEKERAVAEGSDHSKQNGKEEQPRYRIPYGGLFQLVSCPHYLCEMIAYTALWIVSGGKFSQFLVCVWVYSNLSITAVRTHRWYHRQFPDYPRDRAAVIPKLL